MPLPSMPPASGGMEVYHTATWWATPDRPWRRSDPCPRVAWRLLTSNPSVILTLVLAWPRVSVARRLSREFICEEGSESRGRYSRCQGGTAVALEDRTLVCRECEASFTFTAGEQEFYQSRGLVHDPARCPECRASRRRGGGFRSDAPRTMYPVTCAACGAPTEVPFEPRQGRPVYCRNCYETHRESSSF